MAKTPSPPPRPGASHADVHPDKNERKGIEESKQDTVSKPGGFENDPDDPTNPNEAIERHRQKIRP
jgi:hypothetical protein